MLCNFFCRLCSFFYLPDNFFQVLCSFAEAAGSLFPKVKNVKVEASECPIFSVRYAPQLGGRFIGPSYKKRTALRRKRTAVAAENGRQQRRATAPIKRVIPRQMARDEWLISFAEQRLSRFRQRLSRFRQRRHPRQHG